MKDIFLSYKAEEIEIAEWVKNVLEKNGISCWMAPASIVGGSSYASEIPKAIRECKVFVLILSTKAQQSKWVPRELDQAINENKIIMPFMIENFSLNDEFNFYLSNVQRYDAYENKMNAAEKMVKEIKGILGINDYVAPQTDEAETEADETGDKTPESEKAPEEAVKPKKEKKHKEKKSENEKKTSNSKISKKKKVTIAAAAIILVILIFFIKNIVNKNLNEYTFVDGTNNIGISYNVKDDTILSFEDFSFDDLTGFSLFEDRISVSFKNCDFTDADLSELNNADIYSLTFDSCNIKDNDIDALNLENVSYLNLPNNKITDVSKIHAKKIKDLNLSGNKISKLNFADGLTVEYELDLNDTDISSLEGISGFGFSRLSVNNCRIKSLKGIEDNSNLAFLSANNCNLTDVDELEKLIKLERISFRNNNIQSLDGLKNATVLNYVDLGNNQIKDISVLSKSALKLSEVYIDYNEIESIEALSNAEALTVIKADSNKISSLKPLSGCVGLSVMSFSNNDITDMNGVGNKSLEYLDLSNNKLKTVSFGSDENTYVDGAVCILSGNNIASPFLSISEFDSFEYLEIVQDAPIEFENQNLSSLTDILVCNYSDDITNIDYANKIFVLNCPLDKQMTIKNDYYGTITIFDDDEFKERHSLYINTKIKNKENQTIHK